MRCQPVAKALRGGQPTVQRHNVPAGKPLGKAGLQLRRQVDFGDQHQGLFAGPQCLRRRAQVDLGLAAAGGAMQQQGRRFAFADQAVQLRQYLRLFFAQWGRLQRHRGIGVRLQRLFQPFDPVGQLRVVQFAQFRRQHRQRHLADTALVVTRGKLDQRAPSLVQRRQGLQGLRDCAQRRRHGAAGLVCPHHTGHFAPTQRHTDQRARC